MTTKSIKATRSIIGGILLGNEPPGNEPLGDFLLTEDDNFLTTEAGDRLILEAVSLIDFLLTEDGNILTTEAGDRLILEVVGE